MVTCAGDKQISGQPVFLNQWAPSKSETVSEKAEASWETTPDAYHWLTHTQTNNNNNKKQQQNQLTELSSFEH